jgi:hypothetical protein
MAPLRWLFALTLIAQTLASACQCGEPCANVDDDTALDYADADAWVCRPGRDDACALDLTTTEVLPDNTTVEVPHDSAVDPVADCLYVYPTLDLRLGTNVHTDFDNNDNERTTTAVQAARFSEVCALHAPLYRQATLGTFTNADEVDRARCFDVGFSDVLRAFEGLVAADDNDRPFVLLGHSQGGQIVSRLVRERVEPDAALRARLVAALPIGWPVGTAAGQTTGGSFEEIPTCSAGDEVGCAVGYRSFVEGEEPPGNREEFAEGDEIVCSEIADPDGQGDDHLDRVWMAWDNNLVTLPEGAAPTTETVLYRDFFAARCVAGEGGDNGLQWRAEPRAGDQRANPVDFENPLLTGANGAHLFDMHFGQGALIDLVGRKIRTMSP